MARRKVKPPYDFWEETGKVYEILNDGQDIACALIGAAYLDALLGSLLKEHFVQGETAENMLNVGVLSEFKARADLAYCLKLVTKEDYQDLAKIAEIRNEFAHSHLGLDFGNGVVAKKCGELLALGVIANATTPPRRFKDRDKFKISVVVLGNRIETDAFKLSNARLKREQEQRAGRRAG